MDCDEGKPVGSFLVDGWKSLLYYILVKFIVKTHDKLVNFNLSQLALGQDGNYCPSPLILRGRLSTMKWDKQA